MKARTLGFTLPELVVVLTILTILVVVAGPKVLDTQDSKRLNATVQSLRQVRRAITDYEREHGALPSGRLASELSRHLESQFPAVEIGPNRGNDQVRIDEVASGVEATGVGGHEGWIYNPVTGEFCINSTSSSGLAEDETPLWER